MVVVVVVRVVVVVVGVRVVVVLVVGTAGQEARNGLFGSTKPSGRSFLHSAGFTERPQVRRGSQSLFTGTAEAMFQSTFVSPAEL